MTTRVVVLAGGAPWGFRMHGGADSHQPLRISRVNPGSKAALEGVREGDLITSINGKPTRDATNSASHAMLKSAGNVLKLGLNEDCNGSPKRRQYKTNTIKKETISSETIQRSNFSSTTYEISKYPTDDVDYSSPSSYSNHRSQNEDDTPSKNLVKDDTIASQKSTISSNCSSGASTPSHLSEFKDPSRSTGRCPMPVLLSSPNSNGDATQPVAYATLISVRLERVDNHTATNNNNNSARSPEPSRIPIPKPYCAKIADYGAATMSDNNHRGNARSRRSNRRHRRDNHLQQQQSSRPNNNHAATATNSTNASEKSLSHNGTAAAVQTAPRINLQTGTDIDALPSSQPLVPAGDVHASVLHEPNVVDSPESKQAVVEPELSIAEIGDTEADVEWEHLADLAPLMKPESDKASLSTLTLPLLDMGCITEVIVTPEEECPAKLGQVAESGSIESIRQQRLKKREQLAQYFAPAFHDPHYLDAISEEGSDLSDRESILLMLAKSPTSAETVEVCVATLDEPTSGLAEVVMLSDYDSDGDEPIYANVNPICDVQDADARETSVSTVDDNSDPDNTQNASDKADKAAEATANTSLDYLEAVDASFQKEFQEMLSIRTTPTKPPLLRRKSSSATSSTTDDSDGTTAVCVANPLRTSIADVQSVLQDEEYAHALKQLRQPWTLKDLSLSALKSLPFGEEILLELAAVSDSLRGLTDNVSTRQQLHDSRKASVGGDVSKKIAVEDKWCRLHNDAISEAARNDDSKSDNVTVIIQKQRKAVSADNLLGLGSDDGAAASGSNLLSIVLRESKQDLMHDETSSPRVGVEAEPAAESRLNARDLNEWLAHARNSCTSETMVPLRRLQKQDAPPLRTHRRSGSLPHELFVRQMQQLIEREKEVQRELELLEAEKRRLAVSMRRCDDLDLRLDGGDDPLRHYKISKQGDIAIREDDTSAERNSAVAMTAEERFRQEMYDEYMGQFAAREERKHNKVIRLTSCTEQQHEHNDANALEEEFMAKVREKRQKHHLAPDEAATASDTSSTISADSKTIVIADDDKAMQLPKHLQEFVEIARSTTDDDDCSVEDGIWAPGQSTPICTEPSQQLTRQLSQLSQDSTSTATTVNRDDVTVTSSSIRGDDTTTTAVAQIWTPKSAGTSPTVERKEFRPVNYESPKLSRRSHNTKSNGSGEITEPHWKGAHTNNTISDKRLPTSHSAPGPDLGASSRLPRAQNPTITLLQKAREGQLPKGAHYIDPGRSQYSTTFLQRSEGNLTCQSGRPFYGSGESGVYHLRTDYTSEPEAEVPRRMVDIRPTRDMDEIHLSRDGMPTSLRSEVRDQGKWYKKMYDTIHKQKPRYDDEYVTVRYKQRRAGRYPYSTSGYLSEPEPGLGGYDSDALSDYNRFATLDRRRFTSNKENEYATTMSYSLPRHTNNSISYLPESASINQVNKPGRIENYTPGQSSIADKEAKQWWDEVLDIFDGHLDQQKRVPPFQAKGYMCQALKESGYESDSTLVFRRRDEAVQQQQLSPQEQKEAYKSIQKGGEVPLHGLRKPLPDRPKDNNNADYHLMDSDCDVDEQDLLEYFAISPNLNRIRVHKLPKINNVFTCYPVHVTHDSPPPVFGSLKRDALSKNDNPPSPPKRHSSRNNTTLRYFSALRTRSPRPEHAKRHEGCFSPAPQEDHKVKALREKISNKLSPTLKRKPDLKSPERNVRSSKPVQEPIRSKSTGSLARTFGNEKKKVELILKTPDKKRIIRSPELVSPKEVKKAVVNQLDTIAKQNKLRKSTALAAVKDVGKIKSVPEKRVTKPKKIIDKISTASKLISPALVSKSRYGSNNSIRSSKESVAAKSTKKNKKDKINAEVVKSSQKNPAVHVERDENDNISKVTEIIPPPSGQLEWQSNSSFFQNLYLRNTPSPVPSTTAFILDKIGALQRRASYTEPGIGALKIYLNTTKPVTDSKFMEIDRKVRSRSSSPRCHSLNYDHCRSPSKALYPQPPRPLTPQVPRRPMTICKSPERYSQMMYFSDTCRPVSPILERKSRAPERLSSESPSKVMYFSETARPISPIFNYSKAAQMIYKSPVRKSPERLIFTETCRPISPSLERKYAHPLSPPQILRSPSYRKIQAKSPKRIEYRSKSLDKDTRTSFEASYFEPSSLSFSTSSMDSCGTDYMQYVHELRAHSHRSDRFKELNQFYSNLERVGELQKATSSQDLRPPKKPESALIDFDQWQEVRNRERAEKELSQLYRKLSEYQKQKDLLFQPKSVEAFRWKRDTDRGLTRREKSIEDIRMALDKIKDKDKLKESRWKKELAYKRQIYRPLWRGNSVVNLAQILNERRSLSEGRRPHSPLSSEERLLTHGVGSRMWSSLSTDQVNVLKNQLTEIYGNSKDFAEKCVPSKQSDSRIKEDRSRCEINVNVNNKSTKPTNLSVRRNSDTHTPVLTENDKRRLSQTLSKEVLERQKQKYQTSVSLVLGKETRGAILTSDLRTVQHPQQDLSSPRTCYSLEMSDDSRGTDDKSKDSQFVVVLNDKDCAKQRNSISETMEVWAQPKKPLVKTNALSSSTNTIKPNSETDSTDGSIRTVICNSANSKNDKIQEKVEFFERHEEVYTPTVYKPAESDNNSDVTFSEKAEPARSNSQQDLREMFGEKLHLLTTLPLSASRKVQYVPPTPPVLRTDLTTDSRSRSLSPYPDDSYPSMRFGDVGRLKEKFENLEDFYSHRQVRVRMPRRCLSDPTLNKSFASTGCLIHNNGQVDTLRKKYEYPSKSGRGRSRTRRGGIVSPAVLKAEDRFMPHINVISKIARLHRRRQSPSFMDPYRSNEDLARYLGIPVGEVEKLRHKFDTTNGRISLLGHMFTSSPDLSEIKQVSPYLSAGWAAHQYPRREDNARSFTKPSTSPPGSEVVRRKADKVRAKSVSPVVATGSRLSSILKKEHRTQPDGVQKVVMRVKKELTKEPRGVVSFQEPEAPTPPPKGQYTLRTSSDTESPRKYVENDVTIHYKSPVRQEIKAAISEEELKRQQAEQMTKLYEEERRRKYLQVQTEAPAPISDDDLSIAISALDELQDMHSRRHTDNFTPSQKSPISLTRYDDVVDAMGAPRVKTRPRSPEPRLVARALYNFVGQSARELTFRKGDVIYVRRQIDKNWYEGEHNAAVGLFPANYVQVVPFDGMTTTHRKPAEGQARAKFNFIAQTHLELSLAKGEVVVITRKVDDNWYEGKIGGRRGIFPASYVDILIEPSSGPATQEAPISAIASKPVASPAAHSLLLNGSAGGKESMGSHAYIPPMSTTSKQELLPVTTYRAKPVHLTGNGTYGSLKKSPIDQTLHIDTPSEPVPYRALYKYKPQNDDELELLEGDTVYVLEKCDDGWFVGSSNRTGAFGTFPGNYVERIERI